MYFVIKIHCIVLHSCMLCCSIENWCQSQGSQYHLGDIFTWSCLGLRKDAQQIFDEDENDEHYNDTTITAKKPAAAILLR